VLWINTVVSLRLVMQEVVRYAVYLGMRPIQDKDLLWIAECALTAPVPGECTPTDGRIDIHHSLRWCACCAVSDGWEEYLDEDGDVFYYECNGGKSTYEHPCDAYFKWMYTVLRQQSMVRLRALWLVATCSVGFTHGGTFQTTVI
jgi:centrosomal protein CEP164